MLETLGIIIVLGMLCQWLSWILKIPSIIVLLITGFLCGPVFGLLDPVAVLGHDLIFSFVELSVALILFDGAMQLKGGEFSEVSKGLKRILTLGVAIHFILITLSSKYILGFSWSMSGLLGGILIVTGPTVIMPALREVKMKKNAANYLKWEGILTDPFGAIIAVVMFDSIILSLEEGAGHVYSSIFKIILISFALSICLKKIIDLIFQKKLLPEFLQIPMITTLVMGSFVFSNIIQHGSGLLTVTILGVLIGNSKIDILVNLRTFKEHITTMSISFVFIIISASVPIEVMKMIGIKEIVFVLLSSFVLRFVSIFFSTLKTGMSVRERILIGSYGPRGIVAVSVAAAISEGFVSKGLNGGQIILPIVFLIVLSTVFVQGLYLKPLVKSLELSRKDEKGVIIIGTMPWVVDLAVKLKNRGIPVLITSSSWHKLSLARKRGIETHFGSIIEDIEADAFDIGEYSYLLSLSANDSFNKLLCDKFTMYFSREQVFHLREKEVIQKSLVESGIEKKVIEPYFENFMRGYHRGWNFKETLLTENFNFCQYVEHNSNIILCLIIGREGEIIFGSNSDYIPTQGDVIISYSETSHNVLAEDNRNLIKKIKKA